MKKYLVIALLVLSAVSSAQTAADSLFLSVGDTLYYTKDFARCPKETATMFGVVKRIADETNIATINVFSMKSKRLVAIEKRIASGANYHDRKGRQLYYRQDGTLQTTVVWAMCRDSASTKQTSVLTEETLFFPDGVVQENVALHYKYAHAASSYERTVNYPTGKTRYYEEMENGTYKEVYYSEDGKKTKNPSQRFNHYVIAPEFPGGQKALFKFLEKEVKYPIQCMEAGITGRVVVAFTVNKKGGISDIEILQSSGNALLDEEGIRVIKAMPNWKPGTRRDKPIETRLVVPISFNM